MAIAIDQADLTGDSAAATATTIAFNTSGVVASGADIFLLVHWNSAGSLSVAGGGLTWTVESEALDAGGNTALVRASAPSGLASGTTITATFTVTATDRIIRGCSFTGLSTAAKEDSDATAAISAPAWTSATVDPTSANNLVITAVTLNTNKAHTPTAPNLESFDQGATFDYHLSGVYRINSSAGSYTNSGSYSSGGDLYLAATAAYGAAAAVGRVFKRFTGPAQLSGTAALLYTCPASTRARVLNIQASNPSGSPVDFTLSIGTDAAGTRVYDDFRVAADDVLITNDPYDLAATDTIEGWAETAGTVVLTITGYEEPA